MLLLTYKQHLQSYFLGNIKEKSKSKLEGKSLFEEYLRLIIKCESKFTLTQD